MSLDQAPIPREALPPGWGPADLRDDLVSYRRDRPRIELTAERTEATESHPALGLGRCWELRYLVPIGELTVSDSIGRVSTRAAALDALLDGMHLVHDVDEEATSPAEVESALEGISLAGEVPVRSTFEE